MAFKLALITFALCTVGVTGQKRPIDTSCQQLPHACFCGAGVINCTNVRGLSADFLQRIPLYFNKLTSLHLIGNKFGYLDKDTFHLANSVGWNLKQLDLSNNSVTDIHEDAFLKFPELEQLKLSNNQISFFRRPYAGGHRVYKTGHFLTPIASKLSDLDLSNAFDPDERRQSSSFMRNLTKLIFDPENRFESLQYLSLARNDLLALPANAFEAMPSLQYLYLSKNRLSTFDLTERSGMELIELHLQSNAIQNLDDSFINMVDEKPMLRRIYLEDNPFVCDCQSKALINWLKRSVKVQDKEAMLCAKATPRHFINRSLVSLDEEQLRCNDGKTAVYTAGVFALCSVAAIGLISLLACLIYANKTFLFRTGASIRNWVNMASAGGYEILESGRPGIVKAEAV